MSREKTLLSFLQSANIQKENTYSIGGVIELLILLLFEIMYLRLTLNLRSSYLSLPIAALSHVDCYAQQFVPKVCVTSLYASVQHNNLGIDLHSPPPFLLACFSCSFLHCPYS